MGSWANDFSSGLLAASIESFGLSFAFEWRVGGHLRALAADAAAAMLLRSVG